MEKPSLILDKSEAVVASSACTIYAAYIAAGKVAEGREKDFMLRSIREALWIARTTDEAVRSEKEMA